MKQKEIKILVALIAIILILGSIMIFTKGLAFELKYQETQKVEINLGKTFEESDVRAITNEIFGKQKVKIQAIEVYKDAISLTTTQISEEQKNELIEKLNEKYRNRKYISYKRKRYNKTIYYSFWNSYNSNFGIFSNKIQ